MADKPSDGGQWLRQSVGGKAPKTNAGSASNNRGRKSTGPAGQKTTSSGGRGSGASSARNKRTAVPPPPPPSGNKTNDDTDNVDRRKCNFCKGIGHIKKDCTVWKAARLHGIPPQMVTGQGQGSSGMVSLGETKSKKRPHTGTSGITPEAKKKTTVASSTLSSYRIPKVSYAKTTKEGLELVVLDAEENPLRKEDRDNLTQFMNTSLVGAMQKGEDIPEVLGWRFQKMGRGAGYHTIIKLGSQSDTEWAKSMITQHGLKYKLLEDMAVCTMRLRGYIWVQTAAMSDDFLKICVAHQVNKHRVTGVFQVTSTFATPKGRVIMLGCDEEFQESLQDKCDSELQIGAAGMVKFERAGSKMETSDKIKQRHEQLLQELQSSKQKTSAVEIELEMLQQRADEIDIAEMDQLKTAEDDQGDMDVQSQEKSAESTDTGSFVNTYLSNAHASAASSAEGDNVQTGSQSGTSGP